MTTLSIKDLSIHTELDSETLSAVRGGENQVNGATQLAALSQMTANAVGNNLKSGIGPVIVVSSIDNSQDSDQSLSQLNDKSALLNFLGNF
jgi:hypothetical protein